jgi:hypothetical protein
MKKPRRNKGSLKFVNVVRAGEKMLKESLLDTRRLTNASRSQAAYSFNEK